MKLILWISSTWKPLDSELDPESIVRDIGGGGASLHMNDLISNEIRDGKEGKWREGEGQPDH